MEQRRGELGRNELTNDEWRNKKSYEKQFPSQDIKENVFLSSYLDS